MLLGADTYTVKRPAPGSVGNDGRYDEGSVSTFDIDASVQPMDGWEQQNLPERLRAKATKKLYTETELRTADAADNQSPDRVVIDGHDWQVQQVEEHGDLIAHYKVVVTREQES